MKKRYKIHFHHVKRISNNQHFEDIAPYRTKLTGQFFFEVMENFVLLFQF